MSKIKIIIYIDRFTTAIVLIVGTNSPQITTEKRISWRFFSEISYFFCLRRQQIHHFSAHHSFLSRSLCNGWDFYLIHPANRPVWPKSTWKSTRPQKNYGAQVSCLYLYWRPSEGRNGRTCWGNKRDPNPPKICRVRATIYNNFLKKFQKTTLHESKLWMRYCKTVQKWNLNRFEQILKTRSTCKKLSIQVLKFEHFQMLKFEHF